MSPSARASPDCVTQARGNLAVLHHIALSRLKNDKRERMGIENKRTAVTDRAYVTGEEILACEEAGITAHLPKPQTSGNAAKGLFPRQRFRDLPQANGYRCPAGERLIWGFRNVENGETLDTYWSSACPGCGIHDPRNGS